MIKKIHIIVILILLLSAINTPCFADTAGNKLTRGAANIFTGWLEIPLNMYQTSINENPFLGITLGFAKGIGMTIVRTCVGAYELATFPFPFPEDYKPLMEPEYVFQKEI
jgi:putative exosortase-associated protein (TIGR04073 family)